MSFAQKMFVVFCGLMIKSSNVSNFTRARWDCVLWALDSFKLNIHDSGLFASLEQRNSSSEKMNIHVKVEYG